MQLKIVIMKVQPIVLSSEETVMPIHKHEESFLLYPNNRNDCQVSSNYYFIKLYLILVL